MISDIDITAFFPWRRLLSQKYVVVWQTTAPRKIRSMTSTVECSGSRFYYPNAVRNCLWKSCSLSRLLVAR